MNGAAPYERRNLRRGESRCREEARRASTEAGPGGPPLAYGNRDGAPLPSRRSCGARNPAGGGTDQGAPRIVRPPFARRWVKAPSAADSAAVSLPARRSASGHLGRPRSRSKAPIESEFPGSHGQERVAQESVGPNPAPRNDFPSRAETPWVVATRNGRRPAPRAQKTWRLPGKRVIRTRALWIARPEGGLPSRQASSRGGGGVLWAGPPLEPGPRLPEGKATVMGHQKSRAGRGGPQKSPFEPAVSPIVRKRRSEELEIRRLLRRKNASNPGRGPRPRNGQPGGGSESSASLPSFVILLFPRASRRFNVRADHGLFASPDSDLAIPGRPPWPAPRGSDGHNLCETIGPHRFLAGRFRGSEEPHPRRKPPDIAARFHAGQAIVAVRRPSASTEHPAGVVGNSAGESDGGGPFWGPDHHRAPRKGVVQGRFRRSPQTSSSRNSWPVTDRANHQAATSSREGRPWPGQLEAAAGKKLRIPPPAYP